MLMTSATRRSASRRAVAKGVKKSSREAYARALREAGVTEDDLRLLRELAEANAHELGKASTFDGPRGRVFL